MSDFALTRGLDRFKQYVPEGAGECFSFDGNRAYLFDRHGNVVTTLRQDGENEATLRFRLVAALTAISVNEAHP